MMTAVALVKQAWDGSEKKSFIELSPHRFLSLLESKRKAESFQSSFLEATGSTGL